MGLWASDKGIEEVRAMNRKGVGLLAIWVSAIAAVFALYVMYRMITPIIGELDYQVFSIMSDPQFQVSEGWLQLYQNANAVMQNVFVFVLFGCLASAILFVIVQSARRRTDEYEEF